ncbi:porin [Burkholderia multivorans]|nr:porin [Burkholderia multivorans]
MSTTANSEFVIRCLSNALQSRSTTRRSGVSRDFVGYGTTQVGVTAGIQQRF